MPRYALLRHEVPDDFGRLSHWDLLLEAGDTCRAWAIDTLPRAWPREWSGADPTTDEPIVATPLEPHRLLYLDYTGPVSGNRGHVTQLAAGEFKWVVCNEHLAVALCQSGSLARSQIELA